MYVHMYVPGTGNKLFVSVFAVFMQCVWCLCAVFMFKIVYRSLALFIWQNQQDYTHTHTHLMMPLVLCG